MKKFIRLRAVGIEEEEEENVVGFGDKPKKKKKKKKDEISLSELLLPIDSILSVLNAGDLVQVTTLEGTFVVVDDINDIKKKLRVK